MRRAQRAMWRRNFAAWLAALLPVVVGWAVLVASGILVCRQADWDLSVVGVLGVIGFLGCVGWAGWRVRSEMISKADALAQLDHALGLHNRLTAAAAGVGLYPDPPLAMTDGLRWNWRRLVLPLGIAFGALVLAAWVPVSDTLRLPPAVEAPSSWTEVESWTEQLAEADLVDAATTQAIEEKVTTLREQPTDEWFSHSSLEAGDSLRDQVAGSVRELERELRGAAAALGSLVDSGEMLTDAELSKIADSLGEAVAGLELGSLPLNREMLADLKAIDPKRLRQISAEDLAAMKDRLEAGAGVCSAVGSGKGDLGAGGAIVALMDAEAGLHGIGGIQRGPGTQPVTLNATATELGGGQLEEISNADLGRALPGEVLGLVAGEHDPVEASDGPVAGGAIAEVGSGGDAVWRDNLTPDETEALQRFFR